MLCTYVQYVLCTEYFTVNDFTLQNVYSLSLHAVFANYGNPCFLHRRYKVISIMCRPITITNQIQFSYVLMRYACTTLSCGATSYSWSEYDKRPQTSGGPWRIPYDCRVYYNKNNNNNNNIIIIIALNRGIERTPRICLDVSTERTPSRFSSTPLCTVNRFWIYGEKIWNVTRIFAWSWEERQHFYAWIIDNQKLQYIVHK